MRNSKENPLVRMRKVIVRGAARFGMAAFLAANSLANPVYAGGEGEKYSSEVSLNVISTCDVDGEQSDLTKSFTNRFSGSSFFVVRVRDASDILGRELTLQVQLEGSDKQLQSTHWSGEGAPTQFDEILPVFATHTKAVAEFSVRDDRKRLLAFVAAESAECGPTAP